MVTCLDENFSEIFLKMCVHVYTSDFSDIWQHFRRFLKNSYWEILCTGLASEFFFEISLFENFLKFLRVTTVFCQNSDFSCPNRVDNSVRRLYLAKRDGTFSGKFKYLICIFEKLENIMATLE